MYAHRAYAWVFGEPMDRLTYRAMYQSIRAAKHHINLEVFILEHDAIGEQLIDLLVKWQQQFIQVNLIYEAVGPAHTLVIETTECRRNYRHLSPSLKVSMSWLRKVA